MILEFEDELNLLRLLKDDRLRHTEVAVIVLVQEIVIDSRLTLVFRTGQDRLALRVRCPALAVRAVGGGGALVDAENRNGGRIPREKDAPEENTANRENEQTDQPSEQHFRDA